MVCRSARRGNLTMNDRQRAIADAAYVEGPGNPRTLARLDLRGLQEHRPARQEEALDRSLSGGFDQVAEHRVPVLTAVVAPRPLVQVALKPLVRDGVMSAKVLPELLADPDQEKAQRVM